VNVITVSIMAITDTATPTYPIAPREIVMDSLCFKRGLALRRIAKWVR